jgi:hypothetical protein
MERKIKCGADVLLTKLNLGSTAILLGLGLLFSIPNPTHTQDSRNWINAQHL